MQTRSLVACAAVALLLAPAAGAKMRMSLAVGDSTPRVGQPFTVALRVDRRLDYDVRVIAVAPGKHWHDVVGTITGHSQLANADIPRDGFEIELRRVAPTRWRGLARLPRPGRWRLLVPCGCEEGFDVTPRVMRTIVVG